MFKNRALQVRMVKPDGQGGTQTTVIQTIDPEKLNQIVKDQVRNIGIVVGAIMLANKVLDTTSTLIIIKASKS